MAQFKYVEMVCKLDQKHYNDQTSVEGIVVAPISDIDPAILLECYINTFTMGDAKFFTLQNEEQRRRYYNEELGFPEVLNNPASFAYKIKDKVIGFALVLSYLENNYHISCMCILPEYQNLGIGKAMLNRIKSVALENKCKSLTLGTETEMKAFHLYRNNGFIVTEEHTVDV